MTDERKELLAANRTEPGQDGTIRKSHYGDGVQPWDTMLQTGWAPHFAAGSILKYLRRDKAKEHSLESARWYFNQMAAHAAEEQKYSKAWGWPWTYVMTKLKETLTQEERDLLAGKS